MINSHIQTTALEILRYFIPVPLGSIPELPADSCREINASEGGQAVSGPYWLDLTRSGDSILARCEMKTGSKGTVFF